jgi:hypothetical protein
MKRVYIFFLILSLYPTINLSQNGSLNESTYNFYIEGSAIYYKNLENIKKHVLPGYLGWLPNEILKKQETFFNALDIHPDNLATNYAIQQKTIKEGNKTDGFCYCGDRMPPFLRGYLTSGSNPDDYIKIAKASLSGYYYWADCASGTFSAAIDHFFCYKKAETMVTLNMSMLPLLASLNKLGHSTTLLANTNQQCMEYLFSKYKTELEHFNCNPIISGQTGHLSTEPEAWKNHTLEQKKKTIVITGETSHLDIYTSYGIPEQQCIIINPEEDAQDITITKMLSNLGIDLSDLSNLKKK